MIKNFLKRKAVIRLKRILRGHRQLKELNALGRINNLKQALASTPCIKNGTYSKLIFGTEIEQAELIIRQYLLSRIEGKYFTKDILYSIGNSGSPITYPLPFEWRKVVNSHGFNVNRYLGIIHWNVFVILKFIFGIISFTLKIFRDLNQLIKKDNPLKGRYVYFDNLSRRNFPLTSSIGSMQNIFTWYLQWSGKTPNFDSLCHDVKGINKGVIENIAVIPISTSLPVLTKISGILGLLLWGSVTIFTSLIDLIRGHWWHALIFGESYRAQIFRIAAHDELAKDYLFHNSGWIYRPLWTYEAEKRGSRILFYFYSTNVEGFKNSEGYTPPYIGWKTATWNPIIVWDCGQQDFINRSLDKKVTTYVVGPIWCESGLEYLPNLLPNSIAVFDVQPVRDSIYNTFGVPIDYYIPLNCNQFLLDIYEVLLKNDCNMVLKRKRNVRGFIHSLYWNLINQLIKKNNFMSLDPDIRAEQLIENCQAVISMPFTSTAIIARELGKPSIYYFPNDLIQKDDRAAHGIPIIIGKKELEVWLNKVMKEPILDLNKINV
jgi:polysaccharide biosynthesis PFTS motif protein